MLESLTTIDQRPIKPALNLLEAWLHWDKKMALQLHSADFLHKDGVTYCIKRDSLDQDFTIYERRNDQWIDSGLDQAVKNLNFAEFKRLGLLIKTIMDIDQWIT